jgi:cyclophilin family peptidyl-prolyl cis-trans isomerase
MKKFFTFLVTILLVSGAFAADAAKEAKQPHKKAGKEMSNTANPVIRITTSKGDMMVELFEDECPNTVANMIQLAESGFYKGMVFHRVIDGFMAQGGCPFSKRENSMSGQPGTGGPGYRFADEISRKLRHEGRGILSMANAGPNTNGSQFFITFTATPWLDGRHAVFGKVISGLEVLDALEAIGSSSGRTTEKVMFNIEVVSKRDHAYEVKKL